MSEETMSQEEWLDRYERRFIARCIPAHVAREAARAEPFEVLADGYEDDPEGAADLEMSYWRD
jgi:hypothetical protein